MATVPPSECLRAGGANLGPDYEDCFGGPVPDRVVEPRSAASVAD